MTRFARAKGSKSSNERLPERATSWGEMKQQLLEKKQEIDMQKKLEEANAQRDANYKAFLQEKEEDELKQTKWADFPAAPNSQKKLKQAKKETDDDDDSDDEQFLDLKSKLDKILDKRETNGGSDSDEAPEEISAKEKPKEIVVKNAKQKKKLLKIVVDNNNVAKKKNEDVEKPKKKKKLKTEVTETKVVKEESELSEAEKRKIEKKKDRRRKQVEKKIQAKFGQQNGSTEKQPEGKKRKLETDDKQEAKKVKKEINLEDLPEEEKKKVEKKKEKKQKQLEKRKIKKEQLKQQKIEEAAQETNEQTFVKNDSFNKDNGFQNRNNFPNKNNKKAKVKDQEDHSRKKPFLPTKMMINGKEVAVDYVDGFPVKKEDAQRLKTLRKEMISKGLPRSEINIALKLERRRAEKAFAREKKKVCFNCRKSGHNLSECPELGNNQITETIGSGICFKCGSTEHTHFECRVVRGQEFKYASCFICNEQGHIARQCPDNPRGLYPKGGGCNVCGDVTHLKKDCPQYQAQQQNQNDGLHLETFNGDNPDDLSNTNNNKSFGFGKPKQNKIVKF